MAIIRTYKVIPNNASPFETTMSARTTTSFKVTGPGSIADWVGTGITYDAAGKPKAGFLTGLDWKTGGTLTLKITGMHANIALFPAADDPTEVLWASADTFYGHNGADSIGLQGGNDTYYGFGGADYLDDSGLTSDLLFGGTGNDTLLGGAGSDSLNGEANIDTLRGELGNDVLRGGLGTDKLYGGAGGDRFDFDLATESIRGTARDIVFDFSHAQGDKIDVSTIDANGTVAGNGTFAFVGSDTFGGTRAELRYSAGILAGDTNGDRIADFEIRVISTTALVKADIIL